MSSEKQISTVGAEQHIGLADAITALHAELAAAQARNLADGIRFPVESMTVELRVGAVRTKDGKAAFRIPIVNAELGASAGQHDEFTQTVTIVFGAPVDSEGHALKVARSSDRLKG